MLTLLTIHMFKFKRSWTVKNHNTQVHENEVKPNNFLKWSQTIQV